MFQRSLADERIFAKRISSRKEKRSQLYAAQDYRREGDRLAVWELDKLGRSNKELIEPVNSPEEHRVQT